MKPESIEAMGEVAALSSEVHRILTNGNLDHDSTMEEAHRLTTAANSLMLTVLCHELLDGEMGLADTLFAGIAGELTN